jgi:hypothetical protein
MSIIETFWRDAYIYAKVTNWKLYQQYALRSNDVSRNFLDK